MIFNYATKKGTLVRKRGGICMNKGLRNCLMIAAVCFTVMLARPYVLAAEKGGSNDVEKVLDEVMKTEIEKEHIPNATISVIIDGDVIFQKGYGYSNLDSEEEVDPESTMFRIGSGSKLFTWTAVMQLVEAGKLDLDTDINQYVDFEIPDVLEGPSDNIQPDPISLRDLLTHTPGFEDYPDNLFRLSEKDRIPFDDYIKKHLPSRVFPPGEVLAYSNYGAALAGYIVENVSGVSFSDYVEENIFMPLDMGHSTFKQPLPSAFSSDMTQAYRYMDGEFVEGEFEFVPGPAGGMSTSAVDMVPFMNAFLQTGSNEGQSILKDDTVAQMLHQQFTQDPKLDGMGLGFMEESINNKRVFSHAGSTTLFDTGIYLLPDENIGIFISYSGGDHLTHTKAFQTFMDTFYPSESNAERTPPDGTHERSRAFKGEYHQNRRSFTTSAKFVSLAMGIMQVDVDEDGYLIVKHDGGEDRFVEVEPNTYENVQGNQVSTPYGIFSTIVFKTDANGNTMLATDGPMTYSKMPWYATSGFTFLSLILVTVTFVLTLVCWGGAWIIRKVRHGGTKSHGIPLFLKWAGSLFGLLLLLLIAGVVVASAIDPLYQMPKDALGIAPKWVLILDIIPFVMIFVAVLMVVGMVTMWRKMRWRIIGRIHYTFLTVLAGYLLWVFYYWNVV